MRRCELRLIACHSPRSCYAALILLSLCYSFQAISILFPLWSSRFLLCHSLIQPPLIQRHSVSAGPVTITPSFIHSLSAHSRMRSNLSAATHSRTHYAHIPGCAVTQVLPQSHSRTHYARISGCAVTWALSLFHNHALITYIPGRTTRWLRDLLWTNPWRRNYEAGNDAGSCFWTPLCGYAISSKSCRPTSHNELYPRR